jgi:3-dehydroquinate synthase
MVGMCDDFSQVLLPILEKNNLSTSCEFSAHELYKISLTDKKRSLDTISLIVPETLGVCKIVKIPVDELENFIEKGM